MQQTMAIEVVHDERTGESGVKTTTAFHAGEIIASFDVKRIVNKPSRWSVQLNEHEHVEIEGTELSFMNHSCDPSVFVNVVQGTIVALRDLRRGDDVTFFYPSTEWKMSSPFTCKCGSSSCLRSIAGASQLSSLQRKHYKLSPHIERLCAGLVPA